MNHTVTGPDTFSTQRPAPPELRVISQPPGPTDLTHYPDYVFRVNTRPSYIYHAELGIDGHYLDFWKRPVEWLYTGRCRHLRQNFRGEAPIDGYVGHSTCTASKAAGRIYGVSKTSTLVIVKMPDLSEASIGGILATIYEDIVQKRRQYQSVVSISWGTANGVKHHFEGSWQQFLDDCKLLRALSVPVFVAAGNYATKANLDSPGRRLIIDTAPATFGMDNIFAIGNCDNHGSRWFESQVQQRPGVTQIYAPGVMVACPVRGPRWSKGLHTGTSFCKSLCLQTSLFNPSYLVVGCSPLIEPPGLFTAHELPES